MKQLAVIALVFATLAATAPLVQAQEVGAADLAKAELVRPEPGSTLPGDTVTFAWSEGQGVLRYALRVGSSPGSYEFRRGTVDQGLSVEVTGLPADGSLVYVRLFSRFENGWEFNDYDFTAAGAPPEAPGAADLAKAELVSPRPGSTLPGDTVTFAWSEGRGVLRYGISVGTSPGGRELFREALGQDLSVDLVDLPTDGSPVYVRLLSNFESGWDFNDYEFTASDATTAIAAAAKAELVGPEPGSTLPGVAVTFAWSEGRGVQRYGLFVGTSPGGHELFRQGYAKELSAEVPGLPTDGSTVYVRLHSRFESGWEFNDYKFRATDAPTAVEGVAAVAKAELVSPEPGSTLPGDTVTLAWSEGRGVLRYALRVGSSPGGYEFFRGVMGQDLSAEVANLPTDGSTVYARLASRFESGWEFNDYEFTAAAATTDVVAAAVVAKAELVGPEPGSTLLGDTVTFAWSEGQGVLRYGLFVGTSPGGRDLFGQGSGQELSVEVAGLPTDGSTVYVRVLSRFESGWELNDYEFTAAGAPTRGGAVPTVTAASKAELVTPAPGSTLPGDTVTFAWSEGQGALRYGLFVGTSEGGHELFRQGLGQELSVEVAGLPTDGSTVYVRLLSRFESGWEFDDHKFSAAGVPAETTTVSRGGDVPTVLGPTRMLPAVVIKVREVIGIEDIAGGVPREVIDQVVIKVREVIGFEDTAGGVPRDVIDQVVITVREAIGFEDTSEVPTP